jgi:hypothetical protein
VSIGADGASGLDRCQEHQEQERGKEGEFDGSGALRVVPEHNATFARAKFDDLTGAVHGNSTPKHHSKGSLLKAVEA